MQCCLKYTNALLSRFKYKSTLSGSFRRLAYIPFQCALKLIKMWFGLKSASDNMTISSKTPSVVEHQLASF